MVLAIIIIIISITPDRVLRKSMNACGIMQKCRNCLTRNPNLHAVRHDEMKRTMDQFLWTVD